MTKIEYAHSWKCISSGPHESTYECVTCKETCCISIDNPEAIRPIYGCKGPLEKEKDLLSINVNKLSDFLVYNPKSQLIDSLQAELMIAQLDAMRAYLRILDIRITLTTDYKSD